MTEQELMSEFSKIEFHVSGDDHHYMVASFGSDEVLTDLANLMCFDEFHEFEQLDNVGNVQLSDNGSPFETVNDAVDTLVEVFSAAIAGELVTEETIRAQVKVWPYGVDRSVFN